MVGLLVVEASAFLLPPFVGNDIKINFVNCWKLLMM
jgi:hypothetical protein